MPSLADQIALIAQSLDSIEPHKHHMFFEVGANDGVSQSNTLILESMGWDGFLVEPSKVAYEKILENRSCSHVYNCGVGDGTETSLIGYFSDGKLTASCDDEINKADPRSATLMSRIFKSLQRSTSSETRLQALVRTISFFYQACVGQDESLKSMVECRTIADILIDASAPRIDIMIIDVEGYEVEAIKGLSKLGGLFPRIIVVETRKKNQFEACEILLAMNYILVSNLSLFSLQSNPQWSGDHQDFLWVNRDDLNALTACGVQLKASC